MGDYTIMQIQSALHLQGALSIWSGFIYYVLRLVISNFKQDFL
jgi:hypothetical protein